MLLQLNNVGVGTRLISFSAQVDVGGQIHLIGPNGAGKSTLLAALAGLLPASGEIYLSDKLLSHYEGHELAHRRAYLCQQQSALSMMPVFQYLSLYQPAGADPQYVALTIDYIGNKLNLIDKLSVTLSHLSGGEWQRVRLAGIFLQVWPDINPESQLLLLDEPYSGLDVAQKVALDALLREFCQSGRTVIMSSHDLTHTLQQADQVWLLARGQILAKGQTQQVMRADMLSQAFDVDFEIHNFNQQGWIIPKSI